MLQYLLYVKAGQGNVQAYVTPCFAADRSFWQQREGCQLYIVGKTPSLALAFAMRERVNARLEQCRQRAMDDGLLAEIRQSAVSFVREAEVLYGQGAHQRKPVREAWFAWEETEGPAETEDSTPLHKRRQPGFADWCESLAGRALLWEELDVWSRRHGWSVEQLLPDIQRLVLTGRALLQPGIRLHVKKSVWRNRLELVCARCGSSGREAIALTICHSCEQGCAYCTICLGMGRSKCCTPYLLIPAEAVEGRGARSYAEAARLAWTGRYSRDQAVAAEKARQFVADRWRGSSAFLIWAVCGAGKTELLFPAIVEALESGGRVLIATPRKDVVLELAPRVQRVFPSARVIAVHGASKEKWEDAEITIATTHQVMRFYQRFFLVVVDEVDAFPYHNDPVLYRAVERAVEAGGKMLYLSATPPRYLQRRLVGSGKGWSRWKGPGALSSRSHVLLPGRYHGADLPVPQVSTVSSLHKRLAAKRPIPELLQMVEGSLGAGRQVFVFVPRVDQVEEMLAYMRLLLPAYAAKMEGVHAADPLREDKVLAFRSKEYVLMVTTTILERGVTIPSSDVVVVGAEAPVFDEASLVQIAGRVGRSMDDPQGTVLFLQAYRAEATKAAVRQISRMNRMARHLRERGVGSP